MKYRIEVERSLKDGLWRAYAYEGDAEDWAQRGDGHETPEAALGSLIVVLKGAGDLVISRIEGDAW